MKDVFNDADSDLARQLSFGADIDFMGASGKKEEYNPLKAP
jgi:hypothetical protein